ncbi:MAG TPA: hypothetical protein VJ761_10820 [Ktedonobacteraceae bacterium]|nr:hypothetical protein [Ktedonobacteraceae bacterium]
MELSEHNGWENRFTWLMHLHLSDDQVLMQEVTALVASTSSNRQAGRLLATWVKAMLFNWLCAYAGRDRRFDEQMRLLAWDMAGSALAHAEWDDLVRWLTSQGRRSKNQFTVTLYRFILSDEQLQAFVRDMLGAFPNTYQCADRMQGWFREQVETLFDGHDGLPQLSVLSALVNQLIENASTVIAWEHVARAFRLG